MKVLRSNNLYKIIVDMYNHKTDKIFFVDNLPSINSREYNAKEEISWVCDDKEWALSLYPNSLYDNVLRCCLPEMKIEDVVLLTNTIMTSYGRKDMYHLVKESGIGKRLTTLKAFN